MALSELLLGAGLAVFGGMLGELWRESRANKADVRVLAGELEGLIATCDALLESPEYLSLRHYARRFRSFANEGAAVDRSWLRAVTGPREREVVFRTYLMAASLAAVFEGFAFEEERATAEKDRATFYGLVAENRRLGLEGVRLLRSEAETASKAVNLLADAPLLL